MDDDEFYGIKNPIQIQELITLSRILKDISFAFLWTDHAWNAFPLSNLITSPNDLAEQVAELCRQLYARDSRKSYCPKNHWHIASEAELLKVTKPFLNLANLENHEDMITKAQKVVNVVPFVIPFELRVKMFRAFIAEDRKANNLDASYIHPEARITVHRSSIFEDGYAHLNALGYKLKGRIAITFISEHGLKEAGVDGGGVFKEFLTALSLQAFNPNYGLFFATHDQLLYPCPHSYATNGNELNRINNRTAIITFLFPWSDDRKSFI